MRTQLEGRGPSVGTAPAAASPNRTDAGQTTVSRWLEGFAYAASVYDRTALLALIAARRTTLVSRTAASA